MFVQSRVRPLPVVEACLHGVVADVRLGCRELLLVLDRAASVAVTPEVAGAVVARVEPLRIAAVEALHAGGEVGHGGVDEQVVVRAEEREREHGPVEVGDIVEQQVEEATAVEIVVEGGRAVDAARPGVEDAVGKQRPKLACHRLRR
jgi:hypothetical protein